MYCQYLDIYRDLGFAIEYLIPCDINTVLRASTVLRWACKDHVMYLCDKHVREFGFFCPYHNKQLYLSVQDVRF